MTKKELTQNMQQSFGGAGLLSVAQVAKYRSEHPNTTTRFLRGVEFTTEGKKKLYFVGDIADRMLQAKR